MERIAVESPVPSLQYFVDNRKYGSYVHRNLGYKRKKQIERKDSKNLQIE
jgi:hypothetical protein